MCGRFFVGHRSGFVPRRRTVHDLGRSWSSPGGLDVERMSPRAQVAAALSVLIPVALSGAVLITLVPGLWWVFTTYFWIAFPALGLLVRGVAGLSEGRAEPPAENSKERELLEALRREGELTPAQAAMETSLSVAEADRMLKELAEGGHLEVRVGGGGLFYALWGAESPSQNSAIAEQIGRGP
jgi:hypothetical protein